MLGNEVSMTDQIKSKNPAIKMLPSFVARVRVRCGKPNCRCVRGDRHVAHYHVTYYGGVRFRKYVRRDQLPEVLAACEAHRELQAQLRIGRAEYRRTLARSRELVRMLSNE